MTLRADAPGHRRAPITATRPAPALALYDGDVLVGWVTDRSLSFDGFADEGLAAEAAWLAHIALAQWVARQRYAPLPDPTPPPLSIWTDPQDGASWVLADGAPMARLVPAHADSALEGEPGVGERTAGFEIAMPMQVDELGARTAAFLVYRTLHGAGLSRRTSTARGGHLRPVSSAAVGAVSSGSVARRRPPPPDAPS